MRALTQRSVLTLLSSLAFTMCAATGAQAQGAAAPPGGAAAGNQAVLNMSREAAHIFQDAGNAVNALNSGNKAAAERDITMAMNTRTRLAMTARANKFAQVVPLYTEIDQNTALGTILAQKNNGKQPPNAKQPVTIDDVSDQFTFVGVDLDKTKARLESARAAISNNNLQAAKDTLNSVGDDLVVAKVGADAPLLAIRENLALAHIAASQSHTREATAALQQASGELAAYAQNGSASHKQQAEQLKSNIDGMLGQNGQKKPLSAGQIGMWWSEVNSWMQVPNA